MHTDMKMKQPFGFLLWASLCCGAGATSAQETPPPAPPPEQSAPPAPAPDFHAALAPYGTWTTLAPYGEVWVPRDMPSGWRPYTSGHWVFSDSVGWTWVADEPWGWAPFHYGRWTMDPALGWVWIPGAVWAPAWVAWRQSDGFVGWAPLPPSVGWSVGVGLTFGSVDLGVAIGDPWWSFVPVGGLCAPHVREVVLVPERTIVVLRGSRLVEHTLVVENGRAVNRPIPVEVVEQASGTPVTHVVLREVDRPEALRDAPAGPNEVAVFRPRPAPLAAGPAQHGPAQQPPPRPVKPAPAPRPHPHWHHKEPGPRQPISGRL